MIKTIFILLFIQLYNISIAQTNLVPNYGFEQISICPFSLGNIDTSCVRWFTPMHMHKAQTNLYKKGSSDLFNTCGQHFSCQIPSNYWGKQLANNGNSYSGIVLNESKYSRTILEQQYKEYIEIELKQNLKHQIYCIDFYYSIAEHNYWNYTNTKKFKYNSNIDIEILITDTIVYRNIDTLSSGGLFLLNICSTPNYETSLVSYKDTVNWIHVQGNFTAKGGERYLTIGNFECNPSDYNPDSVAIYIYIDDVRLYKCDPDSANKIDSLIIPNVFTPNGDGYNDKFEYENQEQWEFETQIFGRWGNLVFDNSESENWDGRINGELVTSGVYFYVIKAVAIKTGEIRIYRGTVTVMY